MPDSFEGLLIGDSFRSGISLTSRMEQDILRHHGLGVWLYAPLEQVVDYIRKSISNGSYELRETTLAAKLINEEDSVLELGAGIGAAMCHLVLNCMPKKYIAVEANRRLLTTVRRNHGLNRLYLARTEIALLSCIMVANECPGSVYKTFYINEDFWTSSGRRDERSTLARTERVPTCSFLDFLKRYRITSLLCDIEGGEEELFLSLSALPEELLKIVIEIHPAVMTSGAEQALRDKFIELSFDFIENIGHAGSQQIWALHRMTK